MIKRVFLMKCFGSRAGVGAFRTPSACGAFAAWQPPMLAAAALGRTRGAMTPWGAVAVALAFTESSPRTDAVLFGIESSPCRRTQTERRQPRDEACVSVLQLLQLRVCCSCCSFECVAASSQSSAHALPEQLRLGPGASAPLGPTRVWTQVCSTCSAYGRGRWYGRLASQGGMQGGLQVTWVDIKLDRTSWAASSRQVP
jgi:hypothetical protein